MSNAKIVARNIALQTVSILISIILSLFISAMITRYLGDVNFGVYSIAIGLATLIAFSSEMTLTQTANVEISRNRKNTKLLFSNILFLKIILAFIGFFIMLIASKLLGYSSDFFVILIFIGIYIYSNSFRQFFFAVIRAFEKFEFEAAMIVIDKILTLAIVIITMYFKFSLLVFSQILMITSVVLSIVSYFYIKKVYNIFFCFEKFSKKNLIIVIKTATAYCLWNICAYVHMQSGPIILSKIGSMQMVGWFNSANQLFVQLFFICTIVFNSLLPTMARFSKNNSSLLNFTYNLGMKYLFLLSLPIAAATTLLANKIILLLYGEQFFNAGGVLAVLVWAIIPYYLVCGCGNLILATGNAKMGSLLYLITAVISVPIYFAMINVYGYIGLAYGMIITIILLLTLLFILVDRKGYKIGPVMPYLKGIVSTIIMYYCLTFVSQKALYISIPIGFFAYMIPLVFIFKVFSKEEKDIMRSLLK